MRPLWKLTKNGCRTQEHGGVPIMPAGMHHVWSGAGIGNPGVFEDGEGIHVGAKGNRLGIGLGCRDKREDPRAASESRLEFDSEIREFPLDNLAGPRLLVSQLWMGMQVVAYVGDAAKIVTAEARSHTRRLPD